MDKENIIYKTYSEVMNGIPERFQEKLNDACLRKLEQTNEQEDNEE